MFDPASIGLAISVGSKAFGLLKQGIAAGREIQDMASQLSEWGKAVSDIAYAAQRADEPPGVFKTLFGGKTHNAIDIFAAQKQCEQQRKELKQLITYQYGHDAWQQFTDIENSEGVAVCTIYGQNEFERRFPKLDFAAYADNWANDANFMSQTWSKYRDQYEN